MQRYKTSGWKFGTKKWRRVKSRSSSTSLALVVLTLLSTVRPAFSQDGDNDGLTDAQEEAIGTDPNRPDTDGDGLLDSWEVNGYRAGDFVEPIHSYGADPLQKDIFVEIDWMRTVTGSAAETARIVYHAAADVKRAFERSGTGIRIHFDLGDIEALIRPEDLEDDADFSGFEIEPDPEKVLPFRESFPARPDCGNLSGDLSLYDVYYNPRYFRPTRRNLFYYIVVAEQKSPPEQLAVGQGDSAFNGFVDSFSDDRARRDGLRPAGINAILVYRKPVNGIAGSFLRYRYSATILHELGHAFGLGHGGALANGEWDNTNEKVNYVSVMNYRYLWWGVDFVAGERLMGFSHGTFDVPLREFDLDEKVGLGATINDHILNNLDATTLPSTLYPNNVDWTGDGVISDEPVRRDLDESGEIEPSTSTDHDDYGKLLSQGLNGIGTNAHRGCGLSCARGSEVIRIPGDYNGDGRGDVVLTINNSLGGAVTASDGSSSLELEFVAQGQIENWEIEAGDQYLTGNFLRAGRESLFIHRRTEVALFEYESNEVAIHWSADGAILPKGGGAGELWRLQTTDHFLSVHFRGIEPAALAVTNGYEVAILEYDQTREELVVTWKTNLTDLPELAGQFFVLDTGRTLEDGSKSVLLRSESALVEITGNSSSTPQVTILGSDGTIAGNARVPEGWPLSFNNCFVPTDVDGDLEDEIVVTGPRTIAVIDWVEPNDKPTVTWKAIDRVGHLNLTQIATIVHGRFDGSSSEFIVLSNGNSLTTLGWDEDTQSLRVVGSNNNVVIGPAKSWILQPDQELLQGRFLAGYNESLLLRGGNQLLLAVFIPGEEITGFLPVRIFEDSIGPWSLTDDDVMIPFNFDDDLEDEILVRRNDLLGVIDFTPEPRTAFLTQLTFDPLSFKPPPVFVRGNVNNDGIVDISDVLSALNLLFIGDVTTTCQDVVDIDDSGDLNITDPVYLLNFLFAGGPPPPPPGHLSAGLDPTADSLTCEVGS